MNIKKQGEGELIRCNKVRCPVVKKSHLKSEHYSIKDNFGGEVSLTKAQLLVIQEALEALHDS